MTNDVGISQDEGKLQLAVIFGGQSSEHSISCVSAAHVLGSVDRSRFDVHAIGISRQGNWFRVSDDPQKWHAREGVLPEISDNDYGPDEVVRLIGRSRMTSPEDASVVVVDIAFPVLHGTYGEDGTVQGALEMLEIPYVGSGVLASAISMDKHVTKVMLQAAGLPVGPFAVATELEWLQDPDSVLSRAKHLALPVFVKPARAGSSIGITKIRSLDELSGAVAEALSHDSKVVLEESIENSREIECAVFESLDSTGPVATKCAEVIVGPEHDFYDFEAKYLDDSAELKVPADISPELHRQLGEIAKLTFGVLGLRGLARVDFFVSRDGSLVINEVNTMPGFTAISLFPRMCALEGLGDEELVAQLIETSLRPTLGPK